MAIHFDICGRYAPLRALVQMSVAINLERTHVLRGGFPTRVQGKLLRCYRRERLPLFISICGVTNRRAT